MKNSNSKVAAFVMMAILVLGTTSANAGILVSDVTKIETKTSQTCSTTEEKPDWGIVIHNLVGIVIHNLVGILVSDSKTSTPIDCGIVIHN